MMKAEMKKSSQEIIGSYKMDATYREPEFADFVSRREFINRTGVFVSPEYFLHIYEDYKKAGVSLDEFLDHFEKYNFEIVEMPMSGTFKYCVSDDTVSGCGMYKEENHEANVVEALNVAVLSNYHSRKYADSIVEKYKDHMDREEKHMQENVLLNAASNGVH